MTDCQNVGFVQMLCTLERKCRHYSTHFNLNHRGVQGKFPKQYYPGVLELPAWNNRLETGPDSNCDSDTAGT